MAEESKKKGGFKKFALGAIIGAAAGAIVGKVLSSKKGKCKCGESCDCEGDNSGCEENEEKD